MRQRFDEIGIEIDAEARRRRQRHEAVRQCRLGRNQFAAQRAIEDLG